MNLASTWDSLYDYLTTTKYFGQLFDGLLKKKNEKFVWSFWRSRQCNALCDYIWKQQQQERFEGSSYENDQIFKTREFYMPEKYSCKNNKLIFCHLFMQTLLIPLLITTKKIIINSLKYLQQLFIYLSKWQVVILE